MTRLVTTHRDEHGRETVYDRLRNAGTAVLAFCANRIVGYVPIRAVRNAYYRRVLGWQIAPGATINTGLKLFGGRGKVSIGRNSTIQIECLFAGVGMTDLRIGENVAIAYRTMILLGGHDPHDPAFTGFVAPVAPLAVESGRAVPGRAARASDPALAATNAFAGLLASRGVTVTGVSRAAAPDGATPLARVESAQVADVVEHMLDESDNTVAEVLARLVAARTDRPATFDGAGEAVVAAVGALRVPTEGARFSGGSGLARGGVIAPRTLTATLVLAASKEHPELRATLTGLPVAGVTGTLADRYAGQDAAVGVVRAKTGTLTGASSLAGTVVDADGRLLVFAVVADRVAATDAARTALDAVASALAGCGCR